MNDLLLLKMRSQDWNDPDDVDTRQGDRLSDVGRSSTGRATDQGFRKEFRTFSALAFLKITGCEEFPEGNLVSWEKTNWFLNSSRGTVSALFPTHMLLKCHLSSLS